MTTTDDQRPMDTIKAESAAGVSCAAAYGSVIRVRYLVDVQSLSGIWQNVEIRATEDAAREKEAEWKEWLSENKKTWKDIRIIKESTMQEVLQNAQAEALSLSEVDPPAAGSHSVLTDSRKRLFELCIDIITTLD